MARGAHITVVLTVAQTSIAYTELAKIDASERGIVSIAQSAAKRLLNALWTAGYDSTGRPRKEGEKGA
jgi:hypothetical protein